MKYKSKKHPPAKDTPAIRKKRLQARLKELSTKGDQEMAAIKKSIDKVKSAFKTTEKS